VRTRQRMLKAREVLLNGSGKLAYFRERGISEYVVRGAYVGYESGAFLYPCVGRTGGLLGIHHKSESRDDQGKHKQWWGDYAEDLPSKGHGKRPDAPAKVIPFGMESLKDLEAGYLVVLCCGEEDALSLRQAGYTAISQPGAGLLERVYAKEFAGFKTVVFYDAGEEEEARKDALTLLEAGAKNVWVVEWPKGAPHGADVNTHLVADPEGFEQWAAGMITEAKPPDSLGTEKSAGREGEPDRYRGGSGRKKGQETKPAQSELLIGYADEAELFHAPDGEAYATLEVDGHRETWPLKSKRFSQWLLRHFYTEHGKAPGAQALTDARATIAARATFDGPEKAVFVRVAKLGNTIYVDLCNERWEAVEVTASDWRVIPSEAVPVKFVRKDNAAPLPHPVTGGTIELLRRLLNVRTDDDFRLLVAWLIGTLNPDGPYPVLALQGEQGSAKSTTVRVLRSVVDPAVEPLRAPPRDERDLAIAASGNWTPALDNLSGVKPWLSDALCRLATGGGFATRELYSDDREVIFSAKRPVILNGIDSLAVAGDLRDRSLIVELPPIPPEKKRTEHDFYRDLEEARPKVLGALLDAVSAALRNLNGVELEELPRMADFAVWVTASEEALGWERGAFMDAYAGNRGAATELALDDDPVAVAVRQLVAIAGVWSGTSTELLARLGNLVEEETRRSKPWPAAPNALSNRLKRIAPALREVGIEYEERPQGRQRTRVKTLRTKSKKTVRTVRTDPNEEKDLQKDTSAHGPCANDADDGGLFADDPVLRDRPPKIPVNDDNRGNADGADDGLWPLSRSGWVEGEI
jgi:hypothetical protein